MALDNFGEQESLALFPIVRMIFKLVRASEFNSTVAEPQDTGPKGLFSWQQGLTLLLIYFVAQVVERTSISSSADLDESEQLVLTQILSGGYGAQPPLYTWIQIFFFKVFGVSIFSLALTKDLLLLGIYIFTYLNTRLLTGKHLCGVAATALLLLIPQIAWESQRDLTHSVLASTIASSTLYCFLRLKPTALGPYILFGVCAGLGTLSKYNYFLFLGGILLAGAWHRDFRTVVFNRRMAISAVVGSLLFLPHGLWLLQHSDLALASAGKFQFHSGPGASLKGLWKVAMSTAAFVAPLSLVLGLICFRNRKSICALDFSASPVQLLARILLVVYGLIILGVLVFHVTDIRERWLQPILISVPILAIVLVADCLTPVCVRRLWQLAAVMMVLVALAIPGRILLAENLHRTEPLNRPFEQLSRQIEPLIGSNQLIVASTPLLAGNLRLRLPGHLVVTPELAPIFPVGPVKAAMIWDASVSDAPPGNLLKLATVHSETNTLLNSSRFVKARFNYHNVRQMRLGILFAEKG